MASPCFSDQANMMGMDRNFLYRANLSLLLAPSFSTWQGSVALYQAGAQQCASPAIPGMLPGTSKMQPSRQLLGGRGRQLGGRE